MTQWWRERRPEVSGALTTEQHRSILTSRTTEEVRVSKVKGKLSDTKLFALARKQKEQKQAEAKAKAEAEKYAGQVIEELQTRGTKALEGGGVRVNMVEGEYMVYDLDEMEEALSPKLFKSVTKVVVDEAALKAAIDAGKIKPAKVARFAKVQKKKPYILVSFTGQ